MTNVYQSILFLFKITYELQDQNVNVYTILLAQQYILFIK